MQDHFLQSFPVPQLGRMMAFIDGENLVNRYKAMCAEGFKPRLDVHHIPDTVIWTNGVINNSRNIIVRSTYYTYCQGDDAKIEETELFIRSLAFDQYDRPGPGGTSEHLGNKLYPKVFKKRASERRKGVDIQLSVDMLTHAYAGSYDIAYLVSGDRDFVPVIEEVIRLGRKVYVAALSQGLAHILKMKADKFFDLDPIFFPEGKPTVDPTAASPIA